MSRTRRNTPNFKTFAKNVYRRYEGRLSRVVAATSALDELRDEGYTPRNRDTYVEKRLPNYYDDNTIAARNEQDYGS